MPRLFAAIIYFDDSPGMFRECLARISKAGFDGIFCIDGAFREFPLRENQRFYSTDGCTEIAKEFNAKIIIPHQPWDDQMHKRNKYIEVTPEGDYFFILDTDEFLEPGIIDKSKLTEDYYSVCMKIGILEPEKRLWDNPGAPIRVYKKYSDLCYRFRHCYLYRTSKITDLNNPYSGMYPDVHGCENYLFYESGEPVCFTHHPGLRSIDRLAQDGTFMRNRREIRLADRNLRDNIDLVDGKIILPPPDATGINRWVKVRYKGRVPYSGHCTEDARYGDVFDVPWWRWKELLRTWGPISWELIA